MEACGVSISKALAPSEAPMSARGFTDVDTALAPGELVHYLDAVSGLEAVIAYKRRSIGRLQLSAGESVLDVGCGTGEDLATLSAIVGPAGRPVGVDMSSTMIAEGRRRAVRSVLLIADVHSLPFDDESFDCCRADRTLMHVADVDLALSEMQRVTRRGGRIVVSEPDWETLVVDAQDRILTRHIAHAICDSHRNGWIGRQLPGLFRKHGLANIMVDPVTLVLTDRTVAEHVLHLGGAIDDLEPTLASYPDRIRKWKADIEERATNGRYFVSLTGFIVAGCRQ